MWIICMKLHANMFLATGLHSFTAFITISGIWPIVWIVYLTNSYFQAKVIGYHLNRRNFFERKYQFSDIARKKIYRWRSTIFLTQIVLLPYSNSQAFKILPMNGNVQTTFFHYACHLTAVFYSTWCMYSHCHWFN